MNVFVHTLIGVLAIALVYPTAVFILSYFGTGAGSVLFLFLLTAATIVAMHVLRSVVADWLSLWADRKPTIEVDKDEEKG